MSCVFLCYVTKGCYLFYHRLTQSQLEEAGGKLSLLLAITPVPSRLSSSSPFSYLADPPETYAGKLQTAGAIP